MAQTDAAHMTCPLCGNTGILLFLRDDRREFLRCAACGLVFVPPRFFLSAEEEKKRYDLHQNSPDDAGYRAFLERLFAPVNSLLAPGSAGLDFGSGPEPVLSQMFEDAGHRMTRYDRYYAPDPAALAGQYDFIVVCEVVEHLREPGRELDRLWSCLKPGGRLGIMTMQLLVPEAFPAWHYKNDPTHICFYAPATFAWLAKHWGARLTFPARDVAVFHKPAR